MGEVKSGDDKGLNSNSVECNYTVSTTKAVGISYLAEFTFQTFVRS